MSEIEDYIKSHFYESDVGVTKICQKFGITPSYFSRIFKKHSGMNLPEYLHQLRIEKAKQLLVDTDSTVQDIAGNTGFYNSRTLSRVFKNAEGVTPGQYRKMHKNVE